MDDLTINTTDCDKEQIQYIDKIQPVGALLAVGEDRIIQYAAASSEFGVESKELLGQTLEEIMPGDADHILKATEGRSEPTVPLLIRSKRWGRWMTCIAHRQDDFTILEIEFLPRIEVEIPSVKFVRERREPLEVYLSYIAENLRTATQYDRVLIYKFASDWHGEVVAESVGDTTYSFLGHHFPASDIPLPARNIFMKNWIRMISDVDSQPIPIAGNSQSKLDLSRSILRAPASIHLEYMRNMGVRASLTLSIICDGKLWGLIACHHNTPKYLAPEERSICGLLAKLVSSRVSSFATAESMAAGQHITSFVKDISKQLSRGQLLECIQDHKRELLDYLKADGFFYASEANQVCDGQTPSAVQMKAIVSALDATNTEFFETDAIGKPFPELAALAPIAAGIIAMKVGGSWCVWTKEEFINTITWAGNPNKPMYKDDTHERLSPRNSFESWKQDIRGSSSEWQTHEVQAVKRLQAEITRSLEGDKQLSLEPDFEGELVESIKLQAHDLQRQFKLSELRELQDL